jgi:hypothetical protein
VLTFNMHYTAHGHEMKDRTKVGFRFAKQVREEQIFASSFGNGSFTIPAGAKDFAVPGAIGVSEPVRIWGLMPHTHQLAEDVKWGDQTWEEMQYTGFLFSVPSRRLKPAGG